MGFSPVNASKHVVEKYKRYLRTIFQINENKYSKQFENELLTFLKVSIFSYFPIFVLGFIISLLVSSK